MKRLHPEREPKKGTEENTANTNKTSVIKMRQEKPTLGSSVEHSIDNRQSFQKENRTPKQSKLTNSVPLTTNSVQDSSVTHPRSLIGSVDGTQQDNLVGLVTGTNEVIPFSNEFSTVERDVESLIAELDSKTKTSTKFQRKQQSSAGKVLQFKLNDSKLVSSSGSKITLSNKSGFIDSITVEIKLNKEQLMNEFANGEIINPQQPEEENTTLKAGKETPLTTNEHYTSDRLKQLTLQRLKQQRNQTSAPFLCEKQHISHDVRKETNNFGAEFTQYRRIATQRWISDLLKSIGSLETTSELTGNDQGKVRDGGKIKRQSGESNSLAPSPNRALHGASIKPALPLVSKQNISKPKTWQSPKITLSRQSTENEYSRNDSLETERSAKNASCGSKGQQKKAERDVRIALWQEKNGCLGGTLRDMQDGLVDKVRYSKLISSSRYMKEEHLNKISFQRQLFLFA